VFVCGGQSNMQQTVGAVFNSSEEIADSINYPNIRVMTVGQGTFSAVPLSIFLTIEQTWTISRPESIGAGPWSMFSAVCWFTGKNIYDKYKVPLGLISSNWGGTIIQAWSSPDANSKCTGEVNNEGDYPDMLRDRRLRDGPNDPAALWNAMIEPLLGVSIRAVLWYQGESNSGDPKFYSCAFPVMIKDWREKRWGTSETIGFYYVQLAPWRNDGNNYLEFETRLSQDFALQLPSVGVAVAHDLGDPTSPWLNDIHPRDKQTVGLRLALAVRGITYKESIQYTGPSAISHLHRYENNNLVVTLYFDKSTLGEGLVLQSKSCLVPGNCAGFEICSNNNWVPSSDMKILDSNLVLSVPGSLGTEDTYCGVRYARANYPLAYLYNLNGLPALPFSFPSPL